jgi:hypothetical protein
MWPERLVHLMVARKQRERKRKCQGHNNFFKGMPPMTSLPPARPHLPKVLHLPIAPGSEDQAFNTWFGRQLRSKL